MAGESVSRNLWFCVASPPGVYSTTSPGIYRMRMRPTLYGRLRSYMMSFHQSAGDLADSNRPDFGTCLIKLPLPRAELAAYKQRHALAKACRGQIPRPGTHHREVHRGRLSLLGFGIGAARGSRSRAHATDTWRSSACCGQGSSCAACGRHFSRRWCLIRDGHKAGTVSLKKEECLLKKRSLYIF